MEMTHMCGTNKFVKTKKQNGSKIIANKYLTYSQIYTTIELNQKINELQEMLSRGKARINRNIQTKLSSIN